MVSVMFSQFMSFLLFTAGVVAGGYGQMHYLANVPVIEYFLAKKVFMPRERERGGGTLGKYTIWLMSQG